MKKKPVLLICYILFGLFSIYMAIIIIMGSRNNLEKRVDTYLTTRYNMEYEFVSHKKVEGKSVFTYRILDENNIVFNVTANVGSLSTPWGNVFFIPEVHINDDITDVIDKVMLSEVTLDLSNYSDIRDMIKYAYEYEKAMYDDVITAYNSYGITWVRPRVSIILKYNGHTENIIYAGQTWETYYDTVFDKFVRVSAA